MIRRKVCTTFEILFSGTDIILKSKTRKKKFAQVTALFLKKSKTGISRDI